MRHLQCLIFAFLASLLTVNINNARMVLDIDSPAYRKVPIVINAAGDEASRKVLTIVKKDLAFTDRLFIMDFKTSGVDFFVKIVAEEADKVTVNVAVKDLAEKKDILSKRYKAPKALLRALSHTIANDIFTIVMGKPGAFRTKIAYIEEDEEKRTLKIMDWDGFNKKDILTSSNILLSPRWSPDSSYLGFSKALSKHWGIYRINLRTGKEIPLYTDKGLNLLGGFSQDGWFYYSSSVTGNQEIYKSSIKNGKPIQLTNSLSIDISPTLSKDGTSVAFVSNRSGNPQIYIMDVNGNNPKRISFSGNYNTSPAWSPDDGNIAYVGRTNEHNQIFLLNFDNYEMQQLTKDGNNENPSFSPDGMFIVFDSDREGGKGIYIMRTDGGGQTRITPVGINSSSPRWSPLY